MNNPWGWHLAINAAGCNLASIQDEKHIQDFIDEVLDTIGMVKIGNLHIVYCNTNDPKKEGLSGFQLLQDSNISFHFCPSDRSAAFIDIFSCKEFDPILAIHVFKTYFSPLAYQFDVIERWIPVS